jgi:thiol-disulfide isomerase/thioredoxin
MSSNRLAFALVAIVAIAAGTWFATRQPAEPAARPAVASQAAAPQFRPQFTLADLAGKQRSSDEFAGKAVIFNFWATWCAPCRREIPLLNTLQAEYGPRGLLVVGIAVDSHENVVAYEKDLKLDYTSLQGELEAIDVGKKFGLDLYGLPVSVFTDKQGRILGVQTGELSRQDAEAYLAKML